MHNLIIFNGPPRSGKDTLSRQLVSIGLVDKAFSLAEHLKNQTHERYKLSGFDFDAFEDCKDIPSDHFRGKSPREAYIETGVTYTRIEGEDYYPSVVLRKMDLWDILYPETKKKTYLITDLGFTSELSYFASRFDKIVFCHILRYGCTFDSDSRNYVSPNRFPKIVYLQLINNGAISPFLENSVVQIKSALCEINHNHS